MSEPIQTIFQLVWCAACGHGYVNPQPESVAPWYPRDYYAFHEMTAVANGAQAGLYHLRTQAIRAAVLRSSIEHWCRQPRAWRWRMGPVVALTKYRGWGVPTYRRGGAVLDIGCGDGAFLDALRQIGWQVCGLEMAAAAVRRARALGLEVHEWDATEPGDWTPLDGRAFDAVRLWHVLEHVRDPRRMLQRVFQWLKPGGELLIGVPTTQCLNRYLFGHRWAGWEVPRHLQHFTPRVLRQAVTETGFTVVAQRCVSAGTALLSVTRACPPRWQGLVANDFVRGAWMAYDHLLDAVGLGDSIELRALKRPS